MSLRRRLLVFAGAAIAILIVLSLIWTYLISDHYNRALVSVTDHLSGERIILGEDFDKVTRQELGLSESNIYIAEEQNGEIILHGWIESLSLHYGILLVISLILATPGIAWRRRFVFIPPVLLVMFVLHIITILIFAAVAPGADASRNPLVTLFIVVGTALFPALIWLALTFRYWFSKE